MRSCSACPQVQGGYCMGININARTDTSFLFSSLSSSKSGGSANLNFLSDYVSIKNGSYGKLMKAYYAGNASDTVKTLGKNTKTNYETKETAKDLTKVGTAADALKESADALLTTGSKSVFAEKDITTKDENGVETTAKGYDTAAIYSAVNKFVTDYNSAIQAAGNVADTSVTGRTQSLTNLTGANGKMLGQVGISIKDNGTLSIDKDAFEKADMSKVKTLFQGNGSYGYQASVQASMMDYAATNAANKANTYTGSGNFNNAYNTGNLFSGYF